MNIIEGSLLVNAVKIAIVISRFNRIINNNLLEGSIDVLKRIGNVEKKNITVVWVPGSYELPLAVKILMVSNKYNAVIALGTIIRGETTHFDFISTSCISELSKISIKNNLPIGLGILTTNNTEQAIERAGIKNNNKGSEAALSVLEMINVLQKINK